MFCDEIVEKTRLLLFTYYRFLTNVIKQEKLISAYNWKQLPWRILNSRFYYHCQFCISGNLNTHMFVSHLSSQKHQLYFKIIIPMMFNMFFAQLVKWYEKYWSKTIDYVVSKYKTDTFLHLKRIKTNTALIYLQFK